VEQSQFWDRLHLYIQINKRLFPIRLNFVYNYDRKQIFYIKSNLFNFWKLF
jgi:hypothetical protein